MAVLGQRFVELGNLVALRRIRVEVVFAGEDAVLVHGAVQRRTRQHGKLHGLAVQDRQRARQAQAHGAAVRVRVAAVPVDASAESFGLRQQLDVDLQPNHRLVFFHHIRRQQGSSVHIFMLDESHSDIAQFRKR